MKLLKLEMQNLASLEGQNTIDFESGVLKDSHIFSIVGATGSGKSTILDAICLALYGMAPRYPHRKGERGRIRTVDGETVKEIKLSPLDCRNILTRGQKQAYSKLTFQANGGQVYRAEWSVEFRLTKYGDAATALYRLNRSADGLMHEEACQWEDLPTHIIGLEFKQFLHTVLIAQGSFAKFLSDSEEERFELLEKLVGSQELYVRIVRSIKQELDSVKEQYVQLSANNEALNHQLLPADELEQLHADILSLEQAEEQLKQQLEKLNQQIRWYADEALLQQRLTSGGQQFAEAQRHLESMAAQQEKLRLHDATNEAVTYQREAQQHETTSKELMAQLSLLKNDIEARQQELMIQAETLTQLQAHATEALQNIEQKAPLIRQARELNIQMENERKVLYEKLERQKSYNEASDKAKQAFVQNQAQVKKAEEMVTATAKSYQELEEQTREKKKKLQQSLDQATLRLSEAEAVNREMQIETLQAAKTQADSDMQALKEALRIVRNLTECKTEQEAKRQQQQRLTLENEAITKQLDGLTLEQLERDVEIEQQALTLMNSEQWQQHRSHLQEGKACPLCGAVHHPYEAEGQFEQVLDQLQIHLKAKRKQLQEQRDTHTALTQAKAANDGMLESVAAEMIRLGHSHIQLAEEWRTLTQHHTDWPQQEEQLLLLEPALSTMQQQAQQTLDSYNAQQRTIMKLRQERDEAANAKSQYDEKASDLLHKSEGKHRCANEALMQLGALTENLRQQAQERQEALLAATELYQQASQAFEALKQQCSQLLNGQNPDALEKQLQTIHQQSVAKVEQQKKVIAESQLKLGEQSGQLQAKSKQQEQEEKACQDARIKLKTWIEQYNADKTEKLSIEDIAQLAELSEDWNELRAEVSRRQEAVTVARTILQNIQAEQTSHQVIRPASTAEELAEQLRQLKDSSQQERLVAMKAKERQHTDALRELGELAGAWQHAKERFEDVSAITSAIGTDGRTLRKIAQCYTLRFLVEHANAEIRKFNSRYELEQVRNSLALRVIDHDRADDRRDTTSLSGGETFIVSLGLALGLSALSSRNTSFDNLFIDEGFGTLDPDTLSEVIDALSMMQSAQGKKVGVISHTDTMSERIATQIRVMKNGNTGTSRIEVVAN